MPKAQESTKPTQNDADRAKAEAKALRAEAEALKAKAAYEQDFGSGEGSDATAEAWEKYQQATNAAARAEANADEIQNLVDLAREAELLPQITKALRTTLRDLTIITDIPECAYQLPEGLTLGDAIAGTIEYQEDADDERERFDATVAWLETECEKAGAPGPETELREQICRTVANLIDWLDDHEVYPLEVIPAKNGREA